MAIQVAQLENEDLKDIKAFIFLKDFINQFEFCVFRKKQMKGGYAPVDKKDVVWSTDYTKLLRFEDYFRKCCSLQVINNMIVMDEYALRLKNN